MAGWAPSWTLRHSALGYWRQLLPTPLVLELPTDHHDRREPAIGDPHVRLDEASLGKALARSGEGDALSCWRHFGSYSAPTTGPRTILLVGSPFPTVPSAEWSGILSIWNYSRAIRQSGHFFAVRKTIASPRWGIRTHPLTPMVRH